MSLGWFEHWTEFWRGWRADRKRNVERKKRMFKVELLERMERMMSKFWIS
jgi:membrane protein DedA with SNARE-associated domain